MKKLSLETVQWRRCEIVKEESIKHTRRDKRYEIGKIITMLYRGDTSLAIDEIDAQDTIIFKAYYCGGGVEVSPIGVFYDYNEAEIAVSLYYWEKAVRNFKEMLKIYATRSLRRTPQETANYLEHLD